ncbi:MAG: cell division protein FtsZ [Armatimonadetes bacterium]|nr:cell division protein FtsZ [Armatimonadota bacterium]
MTGRNLFDSQVVIKVMGVGGGGCNAVNRMIQTALEGVKFVALNTDMQALNACYAEKKLALGDMITRGLGTGGDPTKGQAAAKESEHAIAAELEGVDMLFITAGMGGGTGTGAAPIVAQIAQRLDILTVGVVTKPFGFEGPRRRRIAEEGIARMQEHVDTLIVIPNEKLLTAVDRKTSLEDAFRYADDTLRQGVQGISDIILKPGLINVDFADVKSVMKDAGVALMGLGRGTGEHRGRTAAEAAATSPLIETDVRGAKRLLINITAGPDFSLGEANDIMEYVMQFADAEDAAIFMGHVTDESMGDQVSVTLLAAGMPAVSRRQADREVFVREEAPTSSGEDAVARPTLDAIELDEIDFDIPAFLRHQHSGRR